MKLSFTIKLCIFILIVLLVPCLFFFFSGARPLLETKTVIKGFSIALHGFTQEYQRSPRQLDYVGSETHPQKSEGSFVASLMALDQMDNPRAIRFMDFQPAKRGQPGIAHMNSVPTIVDAWGNPLYILTAHKKSTKIPWPGRPSEHIQDKYGIYSAGPDGDPNTWHDNVTSWD